MQPGEATCLMCGAVVGEIEAGRFIHHAGCERPVRWQARLPRCCRCGGSLYVDPSVRVPGYAGKTDLRSTSVLDL